MRVVIVGECVQLSRQVDRVPEERVIEIFAADGTDQPFNKRMRNWCVRNRFDLVVRNNSRRGCCRVRRLQTRAESGMMNTCCSWRERSWWVGTSLEAVARCGASLSSDPFGT